MTAKKLWSAKDAKKNLLLFLCVLCGQKAVGLFFQKPKTNRGASLRRGGESI